MNIVRISPWREPDRLTDRNDWVPPADVWETPDAYRIDVELPAFRAEDVQLAVQDGVLAIHGERHRAEHPVDVRQHRLERRHGSFNRRFRLPKDAAAEQISARVVNGLLEVTIGKQVADKPRRIEVVAA